MHQNNIFFIFKKLSFRSAHQNNPKHIKKLIFNKKKLNFLKTPVSRVSKRTLKTVSKASTQTHKALIGS
jgi:hypothetical protein